MDAHVEGSAFFRARWQALYDLLWTGKSTLEDLQTQVEHSSPQLQQGAFPLEDDESKPSGPTLLTAIDLQHPDLLVVKKHLLKSLSPGDVLLVRQEYLEALQYFEAQSTSPGVRGKATIVTGQPGIGKSSFLAYVLLYRLSKQLRTAIYPEGSYIWLFTESGVSFYDPDSRMLKLPPETWTLMDTSDVHNEPKPLLLDASHFFIQAASPNSFRPAGWAKQRFASEYYMAPFSWPEMSFIVSKEASALAAPAEWQNFCKRAYEDYAQDARTCLKLAFAGESGLKKREAAIRKRAQGLYKGQGLLDSSKDLAFGEDTALLFVSWPEEGDRELREIKFASPYVQTLVMEELGSLDHANLTQLMALFERVPDLASAHGSLFESLIHKSAKGEEKFELASIKSLGEGTRSSPRFTPQISLASKLSVSPRFYAYSSLHDLRAELDKVQPGQILYCRPHSSNQPTFDALIWDRSSTKKGDQLFLLQMTVALTHAIKESGLDQLAGALSESMQPLGGNSSVKKAGVPWHFVFVRPNSDPPMKRQSLVSAKQASGVVWEQSIVQYSAVWHLSTPNLEKQVEALHKRVATLEQLSAALLQDNTTLQAVKEEGSLDMASLEINPS